MVLTSARKRLMFLGLLAFAATGCASVNVSVPGMGSGSANVEVGASERVALVDATQSLADNPWQGAGDRGMLSMMFGGAGDSARDRAVNAYLATLSGGPEAKANAVLADVDHALAKARRVAEAGRQAVTAIAPVDADIQTLEAAIGDIRECRIMYVRALESLAKDGAPVDRRDVRVVRDAFTQTITDIGYTADIVATRVRATSDRSQFAAGHETPEPSNGGF